MSVTIKHTLTKYLLVARKENPGVCHALHRVHDHVPNFVLVHGFPGFFFFSGWDHFLFRVEMEN